MHILGLVKCVYWLAIFKICHGAALNKIVEATAPVNQGSQFPPLMRQSHRSSLFWVHDVCFYNQFVSNVRQLFAADNFSRRHFQMHFFLGALKCMFMLFNILLYPQINISLWTNFIFTDHLSIWLVNYRSFYSRLSNLLGAAILQLLAHINLS